MSLSTFGLSRRRLARIALFWSIVAGSLAGSDAKLAADQTEWPYQWPIQAPITDPFRAPASPFAAGNRGIEFATHPGASIVAASIGRVSFDSSVAGLLYVTIVHPDGVRTSYGPLRTIDVQTGNTVGKGDPIGTTIDWVFVSARIADAYVDPAVLFGRGESGPAHLIALAAAPLPFLTTARSAVVNTEPLVATVTPPASTTPTTSTKILSALSAFVSQRLH